jgi:hypothetical protein
MADGDRYAADAGGVWNKHTGSYESTDAPRPPVPTYRYAQKEAMKRGDSSTYFMRKTERKNKRGKGRT